MRMILANVDVVVGHEGKKKKQDKSWRIVLRVVLIFNKF